MTRAEASENNAAYLRLMDAPFDIKQTLQGYFFFIAVGLDDVD
ncbi:hypothetical protein V3H18_03655 [Methylocystis sp. 9N]|uniref:Uncharacterized protein n=1 Tax=Methylocystis borbori TaxID=3118750 RepID=A0ABU7XE06_9HYPH